jgi:tryptophan 2,3-dioxygenase
MDQEPLSYIRYLNVDALLSQQQCRSNHHDEMLFIIIHQVYELWFKEILHELDAILRCFHQDDAPQALKVLNRIVTIQKVLVTQIDVLETMTPTEFAAFRDQLRPASGFQSAQFREVEFLSGLKNPAFLTMFKDIPDAFARLEDRMNAPTLYDGFLGLLSRRGFAIAPHVLNRTVRDPYTPDNSVLDALETIYTQIRPHYDLYLLSEALLNYEENISLWRFRHVKMVERTIGSKTGTGGSSGAAYLYSTLEAKCFPELWQVRNRLGSY